MATEIPTISLKDFSAASPESRLSTAKQFIAACQEYGFVYLKGLPILEPAIFNEAFEWTRKVFALSVEDKMMAKHPPGYTVHRGYMGVGREKVVEGGTGYVQEEEEQTFVVDQKESYDLGHENNPIQPNQWLPEDVLPGFKEYMVHYHSSFHESAKIVFEVIELGLGLEKGFFASRCSSVENQLRLLHYPSLKVDKLEDGGSTRFGAHADWSAFTMLLQDETGGLQVQFPSSEFFEVTPQRGTLVLNVGDVLKRWSNDHLKSSMHRVGIPSRRTEDGTVPERYSIPYFVQVDPDCLIECLPAYTNEENPSKYKPVLLGDYLGAKALGKDVE